MEGSTKAHPLHTLKACLCTASVVNVRPVVLEHTTVLASSGFGDLAINDRERGVLRCAALPQVAPATVPPS